MNKRIKKKKYKQYHRQFCHVSYAYKQRWTKDKYSDSYQCPKCGWDSLDADSANMKMAKILWNHGSFYDYEFEAEYKCPVCGTIFSYVDGT